MVSKWFLDFYTGMKDWCSDDIDINVCSNGVEYTYKSVKVFLHDNDDVTVGKYGGLRLNKHSIKFAKRELGVCVFDKVSGELLKKGIEIERRYTDMLCIKDGVLVLTYDYISGIIFLENATTSRIKHWNVDYSIKGVAQEISDYILEYRG